MTRSISVLLAQLDPPPHDVGANLETACRLVDKHPEASLAVFPELFLQAYAPKNVEPIDVDAAEGPIAVLRACARRRGTAIVVGLAEMTAAGMANTALCVDERGQIAARYRKVHLFDGERRVFLAGDEYVTADMCGMTVAPLICYDIEFPEAPRAVAHAGAQLLVTIAANMDPYADDHALFIRCRALENGLPHVYVNCVGERGNFRFCGGSAVIDASGHVLAQLPAYEPALVVAEVPTAERRTPDYLADRRPDVAVRTLAPLREGTEPTEPTGPTEPTEPMLLSAAVSKAPRR